jgi:endonuclease YncB( thermonuclease family)
VAAHEISAATLVGKVIQVNDGDELTIFNLNRPVRIKLIGIDAPEMDQAFGVTAKQHLADLVFDKQVVVEYLGIGHGNSLIGRVLCNDADMNAQMIRDGAAWFDPRYQSQLSAQVNEIYHQSELAARNEKRGLWQSGDAVAPWEFVKAKQTQKNTAQSTQKTSLSQVAPPAKAVRELTSIGLLKTGSAMPPPRPDQYVESSDKSWFYNGEFRKSWKRFRITGEDFSAMLPNGGEQSTKSVPFRLANSERIVEREFPVSYYRARDGYSVYELLWFQVPEGGPADPKMVDTTLDAIINNLIVGVQSPLGDSQCRPLSKTDVSANGYTGAEFDLTGCTLPGMARVFTKVIADQRKYYIGFTFYREADANVDKFLKSFTVNPTVKREAVKSKGTK